MGATSPAPRPAPPEEEPRCAWPGTLGGYLGLGRQPARRPPCIRTDSRSELACDAFRCGCCCTLLLYEPLELCDQIFDLWSLTWGGAMGIRTPDLLHAMQWQHVHGSASVQVTVSGGPHQSPGIQAGCCTFVLYRSALRRCEQNESILWKHAAEHSSALYLPGCWSRCSLTQTSVAFDPGPRQMMPRGAGRRRVRPAPGVVRVSSVPSWTHPAMAPSGTQLSGWFLRIREALSDSGLPELVKRPLDCPGSFKAVTSGKVGVHGIQEAA
jgi:hypothetical protein